MTMKVEDRMSITELALRVVSALGLDATDDRMDAVRAEILEMIEDGFIEVEDED